MRSFMADHCRKHPSLPGGVLRALLRPSIDPRPRLDCPDAKFVLFDIVIISVIVIILRPRLSDTAIEFECSNVKMIIWNNWQRFNVPPFQVNSTTTTDFCLPTMYVHAI